MRLFTILAGKHRMLTLNAEGEEEVREAIHTWLGLSREPYLTVRPATPHEAAAWRVSAIDAGDRAREQAADLQQPIRRRPA